ncbi:MAG: hypothetical protein L5655_10510 [Thermosediminibacteraceae bacterium]|nr:hypothetical protein [Thermosediminibacteraceae bacterium]
MENGKINVDTIEKGSCYGCTSCAVVCKSNAIIIETNEDGFLVPKIDFWFQK